MLQLVRSERRISEYTYAPIITTDADTEPVPIEGSDSDEVRYIVVKTSRFATDESLARFAVRQAESRRPREVYESRFLVRSDGRIKTKGVSAADRRVVRELVRERRIEIKRCLVAAQSRRPEVIVKAPSALVVDQVLQHGDGIYEFSVRFEAGRVPTVKNDGGSADKRGLRERALGEPGLDEQACRCVGAALWSDTEIAAPVIEVPVVAFAQRRFGYGGGDSLHSELASQAARLGWQHYDRGEFHRALSYFEDAYWVYHLVEYKVLSGMALEALHRPAEAADAYDVYVAKRRDAPDTLALRTKILRLRGTVGP